MRVVVPVHLGDNQIGTTCLPWQKYVGPLPVRRQDTGLTAFGAEVIHAANELGVIIDGLEINVPEPHAAALLGIAALARLSRRRRRLH